MNIFKKLLLLTVLGFTTIYAPAQTGMFDDEERFDAEVTVHYYNDEYTPSKKAPYYLTKNEVHIKGRLSCQIMTYRLRSYVSNPGTKGQCTYSMHCPILTGSSKYREYNEKGEIVKDVNFPLEVSNKGLTMEEKSNRLVITSTSSASGINEMEALNLEIKHYDAPNGQIQPVTPHYVVWLTGGKDINYITKSPVGNGSGKHWDIYKDKLVPTEGPFNIGIPYSICAADHNVEAPEVYEQILVTYSKELEKYLLDPDGSFVIKGSAKRYNLNEGNQEREGRVEVEIKLTPHVSIPAL